MSTVPAVSASATVRRPKVIPWFLATMILLHLLVPLAFLPYGFTWWGFAALLIGNFIFGSIGINLAYHRLLTHRAVEVPKWLERVFILCGVCCLEGSPLWWVLNHRIHHQNSDEEGDPHSPQESFFWGHMQWIYTPDPQRDRLSTYEKYVPDLMTDPFLRWLHRGHKWVLVYFLHALAIAAVGFGVGFLVADTVERAVQIGVQVFLWGVVVRTVYVWHITWLVNSAAHRWGYRNYQTPDRSTNNWFVALLTNGEGWHNNHHAAPRTCSQGHRWWEVDLTFTFVRALQLVGLAWAVVPVKVASYRQKAEEKQEKQE
ncbi:MAG TPA: fatty acid desaturase [Gemmataceae bacterium]|nr:fatty acid desaturase [Gemmataceae bacterium]